MKKTHWFGKNLFGVIELDALDEVLSRLESTKCAPDTIDFFEKDGKVTGMVMYFPKIITMDEELTTELYHPMPAGSSAPVDNVRRDARAVRITTQKLESLFRGLFGPTERLKKIEVTYAIEDKNVVSYGVIMNYQF